MTPRPTRKLLEPAPGIGGPRPRIRPAPKTRKEAEFQPPPMRALDRRGANGWPFSITMISRTRCALSDGEMPAGASRRRSDLLRRRQADRARFRRPALQTRLVAGFFSFLQLPLPLHHRSGASSCGRWAASVPSSMARRITIFFFALSNARTASITLPRILYHWRRSATSTSDNIRRKPEALEAGRRALEAHL